MQVLSSLPSPALSVSATPASSHPSLCFSWLGPFGSLLSVLAFAQDAASAGKSAWSPLAQDSNPHLLTASPGLSLRLTGLLSELQSRKPTLLILLLSGTFFLFFKMKITPFMFVKLGMKVKLSSHLDLPIKINPLKNSECTNTPQRYWGFGSRPLQ